MGSRQDKATTERHARTLRELLKKPENKVCADCKRNDPRWASWNIGVFLCIRCSGIHRSMGTHISKVKSVDLDVWTPEQMASIQKWGNRLANLYWEAHLKPGHIPADHKMESFIRSKYESRRWAMEGPPPSDPSTLDSQSSGAATTSTPTTTSAPQLPSRTASPIQSNVAASASRSSITNRQPQPHQLLSTSVANRAQQSAPKSALPAPAAPQPQVPQAPAPAPAASSDLFSLDFHAPASAPSTTSASPPPRKDVKQDILSLFSTPTAPPAAPAAVPTAFGQFAQAPVQPGWPGAQAQAQATVTSMVGHAGVGMWGTSSGWSPAQAPPAQSNLWGSPAGQPTVQQQQSLFTTSDVWGSSNGAGGGAAGGDLFSSSLPAMQKKDDAFGDIWGGFK
ncbi:ArfGap-domain-containing protein [Daedalea quercina L-15889]|uniref:ArfGap-domain-containing protein n=1 Tax=Daedalea quercina L-15889 TaxID=1314783 RepID=A0A165Q027_9APHY|nr:ArfGap-domain-containing protein [Daedalea quercina L-15889]